MEKFPQSWHSINLVIELLVTDEEVILDFEELGWVESNPLIVKNGIKRGRSFFLGHKKLKLFSEVKFMHFFKVKLEVRF